MKSQHAGTILRFALGLAYLSSSIVQAANPVEDLKGCARITDREARCACYDNLGERILREESATEESLPEMIAPMEATAAPTVSPSPPDDIADQNDEGRSQSAEVQYGSVMTSCKKGRDLKWTFYFDNGQVWKQTTSRTLHFKECVSNATITRDGFGYKMQIDGDKTRIRVARKR